MDKKKATWLTLATSIYNVVKILIVSTANDIVPQ